MAQGKAFAGSNQLGFPIRLPSGEVAFAQAYVLVDPVTGTAIGASNNTASQAQSFDTNGNPVPTYKAHTYAYDDNGNLLTDTVTDDTNTWVRTYDTGPTGRNSDSGWVKQ